MLLLLPLLLVHVLTSAASATSSHGCCCDQVDVLQVMYYPQATPKEKGPTELLPGSHFMPTVSCSAPRSKPCDKTPVHTRVIAAQRLEVPSAGLSLLFCRLTSLRLTGKVGG